MREKDAARSPIISRSRRGRTLRPKQPMRNRDGCRKKFRKREGGKEEGELEERKAWEEILGIR